MQASIVDLRYKMKDVLKALRRNENVTILYRGKASGVIMPIKNKLQKKEIKNHPFFGMHKNSTYSVADEMESLRGGRYKDIENAV